MLLVRRGVAPATSMGGAEFSQYKDAGEAVAYIDQTLDYLVTSWGLFHFQRKERW